MFLKKSKKAEKLLYSYEGPPCRREYVRVRPLYSSPVKLDFGGQPAVLRDLSAGGFACEKVQAQVGDVKEFLMELPGEKKSIKGRAQVLLLDEESGCHCRFLDLTPDQADTIHHYALAVQKEELRLINLLDRNTSTSE